MHSIRLKLLLPIIILLVLIFALLLGLISTVMERVVLEYGDQFAQSNVDQIYQMVATFEEDLQRQRRIKLEETQKRLSQLTETAVGVLDFYYQQFLRGAMSEARAQDQAKAALAGLRYGENGYFWMDSDQYELLVLPPDPSQVGRDRENIEDVNGKKMVKELVDGAVADGSTFVEYWFPKLSNGEPFPKLGNTRYFEPWGWVPGTGEYIDEIDAEIARLEAEGLEQLNRSLYAEQYFDSYPFIKDREGTYIAYVNQDRLGEQADSRDVETGASLNELYFTTGDGRIEYNFTKNGAGSYKKFGYVRTYKPRGWVIVYTLYEEDLLIPVRRAQMVITIIGFGAIIMMALMVSFIINRATKPIRNATDLLKDIAEGEGDLTQRLSVESRDEVGLMADSFNRFVDSLALMVADLKRTSDSSKDDGAALAANTEEISASAEEISATIKSLNRKIEGLNGIVGDTRRLTGEIESSIRRADSSIEGQSASIAESSAAVNEMVASVENLSRVSADKRQTVDKLGAYARSSGERVRETAQEILAIAESVDAIVELTDVINNISDQINMLSMNAAIEAAHAGDAGKGFAVVAEEIRRLAESTNQQAAGISATVKKVADRIEGTTSGARETEEAMAYIIENVGSVGEAMGELLGGLQEISAGSGQISAALNELVSSAGEVREVSGEVRNRSGDISEAMATLEQVSAENQQAVSEILSGIQQISSAIQEIAELGNRNAGNVESIDGMVSRFKV